MGNKINKNYVTIVLDSSGSMDARKLDVIQMVNSMMDTIFSEAKDEDALEIRFSMLTFSDHFNLIWAAYNENPKRVTELNRTNYTPCGNTALLDAVGLAVNSLLNLPDAESENTNFLVLVITDGYENHSVEFSKSQIETLLSKINKKDNWTLAFNVPYGNGDYLRRAFKVPKNNIKEWDSGSEVSIRETRSVNNQALSSYYTEVKSGSIMGSSNFYTDLSNLSRKDIVRNLVDVSSAFKQAKVNEHISIKEFVELTLKRKYVIGSTYYCLTKPEVIQPNKNVLLMEKGSKVVWGGEAARGLIGLPPLNTPGAHVKVVPGNHSNYDIYVQSTSINRKLIPSTKILVDLKLTKDLEPTWK